MCYSKKCAMPGAVMRLVLIKNTRTLLHVNSTKILAPFRCLSKIAQFRCQSKLTQFRCQSKLTQFSCKHVKFQNLLGVKPVLIDYSNQKSKKFLDINYFLYYNITIRIIIINFLRRLNLWLLHLFPQLLMQQP